MHKMNKEEADPDNLITMILQMETTEHLNN